MPAYYNEIDPFAAAWLRELIKAGLIADGIVDTRSIEDVLPDELDGFTQCHFFAGIGVWSYALRKAGWQDDRQVWTGSCPCQPFSAAGKRGGTADERHLWPHFFHLIRQCCPVTVFGEQVASKDGLAWLDTVQADLEGEGYTCGAVDTCAAGFGAPHIRQRLYWVAEASNKGLEEQQRIRRASQQSEYGNEGKAALRGSPPDVRMADSSNHRRDKTRECFAAPRNDGIVGNSSSFWMADPKCTEKERQQQHSRESISIEKSEGFARDFSIGGMANAELLPGCTEHERKPRRRSTKGPDHIAEPWRNGEKRGPYPTNGHWRDVDWLFCRDGKWRPTQPEVSPLAHGATNRVGLLRGAGNAIVAPQAEEFIRAVMLGV